MQVGDIIPADNIADVRPLPIREGHAGETLAMTDAGLFWATVLKDGSIKLGDRVEP